MKAYYVTSLILFVVFYIGIIIGSRVLGGETIVPTAWSIVFMAIIANTIIAMVLFVVNLIRNKI
ncbi:MAG: hypothetical protein KAY50_00760 [Chitinophagaceae bacterium]|nr:hypothetical protein [Chitinophagaceae bacterium]